MTKSKFTTMIIKFVIIIIIIVVYIISTQNGKSPLDVARTSYYSTQGVIKVLEAHEKKPEAQTK